jgi:hypothetical protein
LRFSLHYSSFACTIQDEIERTGKGTACSRAA